MGGVDGRTLISRDKSAIIASLKDSESILGLIFGLCKLLNILTLNSTYFIVETNYHLRVSVRVARLKNSLKPNLNNSDLPYPQTLSLLTVYRKNL